MGVPPPPGLTREEFRRRRAELIAQGKPLTMRNIDPALAAWADSGRRQMTRLWLAMFIAVVACFVVIIIALATGGTRP